MIALVIVSLVLSVTLALAAAYWVVDNETANLNHRIKELEARALNEDLAHYDYDREVRL
jgi:hypothetical protein